MNLLTYVQCMHSNLISELPNVGYSYKSYSSLPDDLPGFRSDQLDTFYDDLKPGFSSFISLSLKDVPDFNTTSKNNLFEKSCISYMHNNAEMGPANSLHASA